MKPCRQSCLLNVARIDVPPTASLGSEQDDEPALGKVGQAINESVNEIPIVLTPPQNHCICDIAIVLFLKFGATQTLDRETEVVVYVLVISELLNHLSSGKAQLCHQTLRCRGLRGPNHECSSLMFTRARARDRWMLFCIVHSVWPDLASSPAIRVLTDLHECVPGAEATLTSSTVGTLLPAICRTSDPSQV